MGWLLLGASLLFTVAIAGRRLFDLPDAHASIFIAGPVTLRMAEAAFTLATISLQLMLVWRRKPATVTRIFAGPWLVPLIHVPLPSLFNGWLFSLPPTALVRLIAADGRWKLLMDAA
jgi:hypothetical protein